MGVDLVELVGAPWLGDGEVVIIGGRSSKKAGKEAYALLKCIYFYFYFSF